MIRSPIFGDEDTSFVSNQVAMFKAVEFPMNATRVDSSEGSELRRLYRKEASSELIGLETSRVLTWTMVAEMLVLWASWSTKRRVARSSGPPKKRKKTWRFKSVTGETATLWWMLSPLIVRCRERES